MTTRSVTLRELFLVAGTRGMLGAGIGLLMAPRLSHTQRRFLGKALLLVGIVSTGPLLWRIFGRGQ